MKPFLRTLCVAVVSGVLFVPLVVSATTFTDTTIAGNDVYMRVVEYVFLPIYKVLVGMSALYFFYGVARFIVFMKDPAKKNEGKAHLMYGMIGMFIVLSVGGIFAILSKVFDGMFSALG